MQNLYRRLRGVLIAIVALSLSASLAFGAQPPSAASRGLLNAGTHAGQNAPGANEKEDAEEDEDTEETAEDESAEDASNCLTDPRTLTEEELAAMSHGSIVCWAAHQEAPDGYDNHGAWVSEWAHWGKGGDAAEGAKTKGKGKGPGNGLGNRP